ncbi:Lysine-specific histone demethylase 1A [Cichlidogyrus casuarinus]|uniref:Lysine-specific histone demethylase 1A n=1 Tax=Cichlidogyrus casuarinus TaxID=1844966 RepID=A0ABD2Q257_9PLAT
MVTRWQSDVNSRGSYSYVSVDATGADYDVLGQSVAYVDANSSVLVPISQPKTTEGQNADAEDPVTKPETVQPRVFFAGEHTCRFYPATVHGAFLSGLRETARIANALFPGHLPLKQCNFKLSNTVVNS